MAPAKGQFSHLTKGAPGNFSLNQHAPKFADRRTKRERDKSSKNRKAIERSQRGE